MKRYIFWETDPYCRKCIYFSTLGTCDYILRTGKARSLICKHGNGCTVRELASSKSPQSEKIRVREELMLALYDEGLNDAEIADKIKCNVSTVRKWRVKNQFSSNFKPGGRRRIDREKIFALYLAGKNDAEIGRELGCDTSVAYKWRLKNGYAANVRRQ